MKKFFSILILSIIVTGCNIQSNEKNHPAESITQGIEEKSTKLENKVNKGDFSFILVSNKSIYKRGEIIEIKTIIKYNGQEKVSEITYDNYTPLYFSLIDSDNEKTLLATGIPSIKMPKETVIIEPGKPLTLKKIEFNTSDVDGNKIELKADMIFESQEKKYLIKNNLSFKLQ